MNSSNSEVASEETTTVRKLPFPRIKRALDQVLTIALPLHIQLLNEKSELLKNKNSLSGLHAEQVDAAKYLKLLKADLFELEQLNLQVEEKDKDLFYNKIKSPIRDAVETISKFMELHPDALEPFPEVCPDNTPDFPPIICHLSERSEDQIIEDSSSVSLPVVPLKTEQLLTTKPAIRDWSFLRKELIEVHGLIRHFATLVFSQKEKVDTIQNNVEQAHDNVQEGVSHIKKAAILKAASFPIAGAIVGGLFLGPVGALAGFKLVGIAACMASGGAIGYKAGSTLKKKQEISCDIEMKALTYSSKKKSSSNPELSSSVENN